ncbi:hypothetical protein TSUD_04130 [Trifolium subterraneum]|nr:hypothetical protein TSUD_04130 [Trifolium subterraneum]
MNISLKFGIVLGEFQKSPYGLESSLLCGSRLAKVNNPTSPGKEKAQYPYEIRSIRLLNG